MDLSTILIGAFVLLVALAIQKLLRLRAYIQSFGVPIDNQTPFFKQNYVFLKHDVKCLQKYGTVWARLEGTTPVLVVAEPDLVKEIMVKKFDKFTNHVDFGAEERVMVKLHKNTILALNLNNPSFCCAHNKFIFSVFLINTMQIYLDFWLHSLDAQKSRIILKSFHPDFNRQMILEPKMKTLSSAASDGL